MSHERFVYPLYGSRCAAREAGLGGNDPCGWPDESLHFGSLGRGVACILPSMHDWRFLQPSEATDMKDVWEVEDHLPWPCIVVSPHAALRSIRADENTRRSSAAGLADDVMRAFRLYKPGWFLDAALSESIHDNGRGTLARSMGAYRMMYHDEDTSGSRPAAGDCLFLDAADFAPGSRLHSMFCRLREHRCAPEASAEIVLDALRRAYGCSLALTQKLLLLFMAMEVMLGGREASRKSASLLERLQAALALSGALDSTETARWFDTESRALRNSVAHGRALRADNCQDAGTRMIELTRRVGFLYLSFSRRWSKDDPGMDALTRQQTSCMAAFNRWLTRVAEDGPGNEHWLR